MSWTVQKINQFVFTHPTPGGFQGGGGWGLKFQKSGKFHELSRKSIKKFFYPPPTKGGRSGNFRGSKIKSPGNVMNCPENQYNWFLPIPPGGGSSRGGLGGGWGGGGWGGSKFQKSGQFHELSRKSIKRKFTPPTKGGRSGNFRGSKVQEMS